MSEFIFGTGKRWCKRKHCFIHGNNTPQPRKMRSPSSFVVIAFNTHIYLSCLVFFVHCNLFVKTNTHFRILFVLFQTTFWWFSGIVVKKSKCNHNICSVYILSVNNLCADPKNAFFKKFYLLWLLAIQWGLTLGPMILPRWPVAKCNYIKMYNNDKQFFQYFIIFSYWYSREWDREIPITVYLKVFYFTKLLLPV